MSLFNKITATLVVMMLPTIALAQCYLPEAPLVTTRGCCGTVTLSGNTAIGTSTAYYCRDRGIGWASTTPCPVYKDLLLVVKDKVTRLSHVLECDTHAVGLRASSDVQAAVCIAEEVK